MNDEEQRKREFAMVNRVVSRTPSYAAYLCATHGLISRREVRLPGEELDRTLDRTRGRARAARGRRCPVCLGELKSICVLEPEVLIGELAKDYPSLLELVL